MIHICNWVSQNMEDNCFLENQNVNLDIRNLHIQNLKHEPLKLALAKHVGLWRKLESLDKE
jgi:hypothetical protein